MGYSIPGLNSGSRIVGAEPRLLLQETDAAADAGLWDIDLNSGALKIRSRTDADGAGTDFLQVKRSSAEIAMLQLDTGEIDLYGNMANAEAASLANRKGYINFNGAAFQRSWSLAITANDGNGTDGASGADVQIARQSAGYLKFGDGAGNYDNVCSLGHPNSRIKEIWTSLNAINAAQFDKTNTVLAAITGMSVTLTAGAIYYFEIFLFTSCPAAGGAKVDLNGGSATATTIRAQHELWLGATINTNAQVSALNTSTGVTAAIDRIKIFGMISVNAGGTFIPQFAQNAASGTSSVLIDGSMRIVRIA